MEGKLLSLKQGINTSCGRFASLQLPCTTALVLGTNILIMHGLFSSWIFRWVA